MPQPTILIVADEPELRETLRLCLQAAGYEVMMATNGIEGLGMILTRSPALAILDLMMPGENGYRVAKMVRDDESRDADVARLPIILLTPRGSTGERKRAEMLMAFSQADSMMHKPFEMSDLLAQVEGFVNQQPEVKAVAASL